MLQSRKAQSELEQTIAAMDRHFEMAKTWYRDVLNEPDTQAKIVSLDAARKHLRLAFDLLQLPPINE